MNIQFMKRIRTLIALLTLTTLAGCYTGSRPRRIGDTAPDFTIKDVDRTVTLSQYRGQVVVLNFWASWCGPCIEETPSLVRMQDRVRDKGVMVLGVSIDEDDAAYHRFLKNFNINFITVRDPEQTAAAKYGTTGWPETFVIDRQGVVRRKFVGPVDWNSADVMQTLSKL
jgi:peroxiredoxin